MRGKGALLVESHSSDGEETDVAMEGRKQLPKEPKRPFMKSLEAAVATLLRQLGIVGERRISSCTSSGPSKGSVSQGRKHFSLAGRPSLAARKASPVHQDSAQLAKGVATEPVSAEEERQECLDWIASDGCSFLREALLSLQPLSQLPVEDGCDQLERLVTVQRHRWEANGTAPSGHRDLDVRIEDTLCELATALRTPEERAETGSEASLSILRSSLRDLVVALVFGGEEIRKRLCDLGLVRAAGMAMYSISQHSAVGLSRKGSGSLGTQRDGDCLPSASTEDHTSDAFAAGDPVDGLCTTQGGKQRWFSGVVVGVQENEGKLYLHVQYDDGDEDMEVPVEKLRRSKKRTRPRASRTEPPRNAALLSPAKESSAKPMKSPKTSESAVPASNDSGASPRSPSKSRRTKEALLGMQHDGPFESVQANHWKGMADDDLIMDIPPAMVMGKPQGPIQDESEARASDWNSENLLSGAEPLQSVVPPLDVELSQQFLSPHFDLGSSLSSAITCSEGAGPRATSYRSPDATLPLDSSPVNPRVLPEDFDEDCLGLSAVLFTLLALRRDERGAFLGVDERILPASKGRRGPEITTHVEACEVLRAFFDAAAASSRARARVARVRRYSRSLAVAFPRVPAAELFLDLVSPAEEQRWFHVDKRIGSGRFGRVVLGSCRDEKGKTRRAALKIVPAGTALAPSCALGDVFREVLVMKVLSEAQDRTSPVASELFCCGLCLESEAAYHICMEYCACGTLVAWRSEEGASCQVDQALRIFSSICSKLAFAHSHGIVHLDLKMENILLSAPIAKDSTFRDIQARLRIGDWGEAMVLGDAATSSTHELTGRSSRARGTQAIQSPEMLLCSTEASLEVASEPVATIGLAADVWSLGCLLFEMLAGKMLFADLAFAEFFVLLTRGDSTGDATSQRDAQKLPSRAKLDEDLQFLSAVERERVERLWSVSLARDSRRRCSADELSAIALSLTTEARRSASQPS